MADINENRAGYKKTKVGWVPVEWEVVRLGKVSSIDPESINSKEDPNYTFKYLSLSCIEKGRIVEPPEEIQLKDAPSRARRIIRKGDVLFSTVRPNLEGHFRVMNGEAEVASTGFAVIREKAKLSNGFLYQYLFSEQVSRQTYALVVGSNYPAVNSSDVKKLKILLPSPFEQRRIAAVLSTCDEEIATLEREKERLAEQKKGLMQQLLTGAVRVKSEMGNGKSESGR